MSAGAAAEVPQRATGVPSVKVGQVFLRGRLVAVRRPASQGGLWVHLLVLPAPDQYSSPATIEILSKSRLGERDEDVGVLCRVGGYKRSYRGTDRETGEQRMVQTADVKLFAVEE